MTASALVLVGALQALTGLADPPSGTVLVGDEVVVRLTVRGRSASPVSVTDPLLDGVILLGRREVSEVAFPAGQAPLRTTMITYELRATAAGQARVGPWRIEQGGETMEVETVTFAVLPSPSGATAALSVIAERLLARAPPPPRVDEVSIAVLISADTVHVGEQLDMVVAAWFPRTLRTRLRRPPAIVTAPPGGAWQYPQSVAPGVAASRRVRGTWMDLYAAHLVLFPLQPGALALPPQRVEYALPVTSSFFSREERYALAGEAQTVFVRPTPAAGRHALDAGVVGRDLELALELAPVAARAGEPLEVGLAVRGQGNVALWPSPRVEWPASFRAYPSEPILTLEPTAGRIAGTKRFRILLVPDSAGAFTTPTIEYPYFDLARGVYRIATVGPRALAVAPAGVQGPARAAPPLATASSADWLRRATARLGRAHGLLAVLLGPIVFGLMRWRPTRRAPRRAARARGIERLEGEFARVLTARVGKAAVGETKRLVAALRAAGVEGTLAEHAGRLRERLRAARYAPRPVGDPAALAAELESVTRSLIGDNDTAPARRRRAVVGWAVAAFLVVPVDGSAQRPETLYEMGALRAAADSFAARAGSMPKVAAHWYNLGATVYRAGADGRAIAAWTAAARLAPRDRAIGRARAFLPAPDQTSGALLWAAPVTTLEVWLTAIALWIAGWVAFARRARRAVSTALLVAGIVVGAAALEITRRYDRRVAVVTMAAPLRAAPYGGAASTVTLSPGTAVSIEGEWPGWVLAHRPNGIQGWLQAAEVVAVPRVW